MLYFVLCAYDMDYPEGHFEMKKAAADLISACRKTQGVAGSAQFMTSSTASAAKIGISSHDRPLRSLPREMARAADLIAASTFSVIQAEQTADLLANYLTRRCARLVSEMSH